MSYDIAEFGRVLQGLIESGSSFVTVTQVGVRGSAPQVVGAKALVCPGGLEWGTVGGGKVEAAAIGHAQKLLEDHARESEMVVWNLQTDIGMTCGGEVKLFFEVHTTHAWPIAIYGAGHVAQALVRLLLDLNCHVTCVDARQDWLERLPTDGKLKKVCVEHPYETVRSHPPHTFFVLISKGHATDLPVLAEVLKTRKAPYVGVIGSRQKASVLKRDLGAQGLSTEQIESFFCPLGLPIGNNTTAEIAISIVAQLLEQRAVHAN